MLDTINKSKKVKFKGFRAAMNFSLGGSAAKVFLVTDPTLFYIIPLLSSVVPPLDGCGAKPTLALVFLEGISFGLLMQRSLVICFLVCCSLDVMGFLTGSSRSSGPSYSYSGWAWLIRDGSLRL
jgi:hypothetical protein